MNETTKIFKTQLPKNAIMGLLQFLTYSISALWLTPYLFKTLGAAAYGLVPLAALFTQYVSIITSELSGAVNRFLVLELNKPEGRPNLIFNTAFALYLILILIQLPLFFSGLFFADKILSIPAELKTDALLLLGCSSISFLLSLLGSVFGVSSFSKNRLDIMSSINIGRLIFRLLLILICFSVWGPKLRYIGYVDLGLNICVVGVVLRVWRKLTPELYVSFQEVDRKLLGPIFKMSFWSLVNQLGALLYLRTDIWIINRFISPVAAGGYAAVLVVSNFIRQFANMFSAQLSPTIMTYWARNDRSSLTHFLSFSMKILSFGLAFPAIVICLNSENILNIWLGKEFDGLSTLLIVTAIHLPINTGILPLFTLNSASNTIRIPAMVTFFMGIGNVSLSYYLGVTLQMGAIGVALATAIVLTLKNSLFIPIYGARTLNVSSWTFIRPLLLGGLVMGLVWVFSLVPIFYLFNFGKYTEQFVQTIVASMITAIICWVLLISKKEKAMMFNMLPQNIRSRFRFFYGAHSRF